MTVLDCAVENRHLFFTIDGARWLVDTGSPISIGNVASLEIAGIRVPVVSTAYGIDAARLSDDVGVAISGLLGMDFLGSRFFKMDPSRGRVSLHETRPECDGFSVPLRFVSQIPTLDAELGGIAAPLFLDTGAPISYWQSPCRKDFPGGPDSLDFHPALGPFTTDIHQVPVTVGGWNRVVDFGRLPEPLASMLENCGVSGILGLDVLGKNPLGLFLPERELIIPST